MLNALGINLLVLSCWDRQGKVKQTATNQEIKTTFFTTWVSVMFNGVKTSSLLNMCMVDVSVNKLDIRRYFTF